jgi:hypothetical protein
MDYGFGAERFSPCTSKMHSRIAVLATVIAATAGFVAGRMLGGNSTPPIRVTLAAKSGAISESGTLPNSDGFIRDENNRAISRLLARKSSSHELIPRICREMEQWSSADFAEFAAGRSALAKEVAAIKTSENPRVVATISRAAAERWLAIDSTGAIAWMRSNADEANGLRATLAGSIARAAAETLVSEIDSLPQLLSGPVMEGFAVRHPDAARNWHAEIKDEKRRATLRVSLITGLAYSAPDDAVRLLTKKDWEGARSPALNAVVDMAEQRGVSELLRIGELLPEKKVRVDLWERMVVQSPELAARTVTDWKVTDNMLARAVGAWAFKAPREAAAFCMQAEYKQRKGVLEKVAEVWAAREPSEAVRWLESAGIPDENKREVSVAIAKAWSARDMPAAMAWLDSQNMADADGSFTRKAADWLSTRGRLDEAEQRILKLDPAQMFNAASAILNGETPISPKQRVALAMKISERTGSPKAISRAVLTWSVESPENALQFVRALPESGTRDSAMLSWVATNSESTLDELAGVISEISNPWERARAAEVIVKDGKNHDPRAVRSWLEKLPGLDPQYRSHLLEVRK